MITPTNLAFAKVATAESAQWHKSTVSVSARMNTKLIIDAGQLPGASNNDTIGAARDLSGYGNDLAQSTAGYKPLYKSGIQNGKPGIYFDGIDDYLQCLTLSMTQPCTYFIMFDNDDIDGSVVIDGTSGISRNAFYGASAVSKLSMYAGSTVNSTESYPTSSYKITEIVFDGASSYMKINGQSVLTGNPGLQNLDSGITAGTNYVASADFMQGHILELIAIDSLLESSEATYYENQLSNKYNIALS